MATFILTNGVSRLEVDTNDNDECRTLNEFLAEYRSQVGINAGDTVAVNGDTDIDPDEYEPQEGDVVTATKTSGSKG